MAVTGTRGGWLVSDNLSSEVPRDLRTNFKLFFSLILISCSIVITLL